MYPDDVESAAPPSTYVSSGRVDFLRLIPLTILGLVVALVMAFALLVAEGWLYLYFVTPLILGLPVFGMVWLATKWGRCRNRGVAGFVGLLLAFAYYAGYWELSYLANVVTQGPAMVALTEAIGGMPGLPGYVAFRCKTTRPMKVGAPANNRPPTTVDALFNGFFFGMETLLVVGAATAAGRTTASRPYSERLRRWAKSFEYSLPAATAGVVRDDVDRGAWEHLATLPRISKGAGANQPSLLLRLEHFPDESDEPVYVSVLAGRGGDKGDLILRREIPDDQRDALARGFPELKLPTGKEKEDAPASALHESLDRLGLSAPPRALIDEPEHATSADDFREDAVAASRAMLGDRPAPSLATVPTSLCLSASDEGRREMKRTSWAFISMTAAPIVGMFGWLFGALFIASLMKGLGGADTPASEAVAVAGLIGFFVFAIVGMRVWTRGFHGWNAYLARRVGGRPGSPLIAVESPSPVPLALEDGKTFNKPKLVGDDFALVFFDAERRRIIAEGLTHRYVIRAEDITAYWPMEAVGSVAARIDYRVGEVVLPLVFATMDTWSQIPFMGSRSKRLREEFYSRFSETLKRLPSTTTMTPPQGT